MLGLIPIPPMGANLTGNIAVTLVLAFLTFLITTVSGTRDYWQHIFNTPGVPWWLKLPIPIMPAVEALGIFTKPIVLMIRLFANITAGHIIVMAFIMLIYIFAEMSTGMAFGISVISVLFNVFMFFLELLVAFIQAFIFTFLSSIYFGLALAEHHEGHEKEHA
jgi:F-type H+-transporting ATPase subunit a